MGAIKHHPLLSEADFLRERERKIKDGSLVRQEVILLCVCLFVGFPFPVNHTDTFGGILIRREDEKAAVPAQPAARSCN